MKNTTLTGWLTFFLGIQLGALPTIWFGLSPYWIWLTGVIGVVIIFLLVLFTKE